MTPNRKRVLAILIVLGALVLGHFIPISTANLDVGLCGKGDTKKTIKYRVILGDYNRYANLKSLKLIPDNSLCIENYVLDHQTLKLYLW